MASILDAPGVANGIAFSCSIAHSPAAQRGKRHGQPVSSSPVAAVACQAHVGWHFSAMENKFKNGPERTPHRYGTLTIQPLPIFSSCMEHTLNSDKDQRESAHANASPPRTQSAIELEDGYDDLIDQDTKWSADHTTNATG
jgi:hypothetical protein